MYENLSLLFDLPPEAAVSFFEKKGLKLTWHWWEMWQEAHQKAFTVAKATSLDILQDIKDEVDRAIMEGISFEEFKKDLEPVLQSKGWWGKRFIADEEGSITKVYYGTPWRLKTIFNANTQSAYMAGRYRQMMEVADTLSYWQYLTAGDENVRPFHERLHGKVIRYDDPFWDYYYPPNGWGCRCRVRALSEDQVKRDGLRIENPPVNFVQWVNKATGEIIDVPAGCDPGWGYNPGKAAWQPELGRYDPGIRELL